MKRFLIKSTGELKVSRRRKWNTAEKSQILAWAKENTDAAVVDLVKLHLKKIITIGMVRKIRYEFHLKKEGIGNTFKLR